MADYYFDELSTLDFSVLAIEAPNKPMNIAGLALFKAGPLRTHNGGVDFAQVQHAIHSVLHLVPRYRQKLLWARSEQALAHLQAESLLDKLRDEPPVWIDDADFDLHYHVRHVSLPRPGSDEQLRVLTGRILEQPLDRFKPLWEAWVVEGIAGGQFAILYKIHHCMADGVAGVKLINHMLSPDRKAAIAKPKRFRPRPAPTRQQLNGEIRKGKLRASRHALEQLGEAMRHPVQLLEEVGESVRSVGELLGGKSGIELSTTPINGEQSLHRNVDWLETPLDELKKIKRAWDTTLNNVVLVVFTGAIRAYLKQHNVDIKHTSFRVGMPINIRSEAAIDEPHNEMSIALVDLPLAQSDPKKQLDLIVEQTRAVNKSRQAKGVKITSALMALAPGLISLLAESVEGPMNCYVTNIPGPQLPLFESGARLVGLFPFAPLTGKIGLCVGVMSYAGNLYWGLTADSELLPDTGLLRQSLQRSFEHVARASGAKSTKAKKKRKTPVAA